MSDVVETINYLDWNRSMDILKKLQNESICFNNWS